MKTTSMRYMMSFVLAIAALSALCVWAYITYSSFTQRDESAAIRSEIESDVSRDSYLLSMRSVLRGTEGSMERIKGRFMDEDDVPSYVSFLEGEIERFGVDGDISSIALDPLAKDAFWRSLRVRVVANGAWKDLVAFMNSLDAGERAARIERASFSKSSEKAGGAWSFSAEIIRYVR